MHHSLRRGDVGSSHRFNFLFNVLMLKVDQSGGIFFALKTIDLEEHGQREMYNRTG